MADENRAAPAAKPKPAEKDKPTTLDVRACPVCRWSTAAAVCPRCGFKVR